MLYILNKNYTFLSNCWRFLIKLSFFVRFYINLSLSIFHLDFWTASKLNLLMTRIMFFSLFLPVEIADQMIFFRFIDFLHCKHVSTRKHVIVAWLRYVALIHRISLPLISQRKKNQKLSKSEFLDSSIEKEHMYFKRKGLWRRYHG